MSAATRSVLRTLVQLLVGLAAGLPLVLDAAGVHERAGGVGVTLAVAAGVTRAMQLPGVQRALPPWLRTDDTGDTSGGGS